MISRIRKDKTYYTKLGSLRVLKGITALLDAGVDINAEDKIGKTVLDYALGHSNVESAVALLNRLLKEQKKEKLAHSPVALLMKNFEITDSLAWTMLHHSVIYFKQNVFNRHLIMLLFVI